MKALVAMSGGVDSSVAAALMLQQGYEVVGVTLKQWEGADGSMPVAGCCTLSDAEDARRVAAQLDVPYYVLDYVEEFTEAVVEPFVAEPQAASASIVQALPVDVEWQITGGGAELLPLSDFGKSRCRFLAPASREELVQAILTMAQEGQCRSVAPQELQPLYLRKSDAELNRQARFGTS